MTKARHFAKLEEIQLTSQQEAQALWDNLPPGEQERLSVFIAMSALATRYPETEPAAPSILAPASVFNELNAYDICECGHFRYTHGAELGCEKCQPCIEFKKAIEEIH